ncbi:hypothetical protein QJS10_CPB17g01459 [Acorus calamus]|uniref:Uncharacterized protein n=1 Tax=Acorus calamus TaxID=4465 RepID=A0AAV9CRV1_ACOCL|nr:hypothetical protein QJS10_CPB17g01459 [Acorus calamus]
MIKPCKKNQNPNANCKTNPTKNTKQKPPQPPNKAKFILAEAEVGATASKAVGAATESGTSMSGLGGLGLDGMVGSFPSGESAELPPLDGEGKRGVMSGERAGGSDDDIGMKLYGDGATEMVAGRAEVGGGSSVVRRARGMWWL